MVDYLQWLSDNNTMLRYRRQHKVEHSWEKSVNQYWQYQIYEQPQLPPKPDLPTLENPTLEDPTQENPTLEKPTQENPMQLNKEVQRTNLSKKEKSNTDTQSTHSIPILSPAPSPLEGQAAAPPERKRKEPDEAYRVYEEIIKDNICYDILKQNMPYDHDRIDEIVDLILETVCTRRRTIRIAGDDYPADIVNIGLHFFLKNVRPYAASCSEA